ncbi:hypothetical protein SCACP_21120 [Sporomusa carbonis]|uniref:DUF3862 domain-containing protein n=1 Tax=Sporomusa carbonis TaxID=3076075 RepID=UPI003A75AF00
MLNKKILIIGSLVLVLLLIGCGNSKKITMDKFNKVQTGMSYKQVAEIMGDPGELGASTSMPGVPGVMEGIESKIYMWKNPDGSNMNVQFQNDKVIGKAQAGL